MPRQFVARFFGGQPPLSTGEKLLATAGAFLGIGLLVLIAVQFDRGTAPYLVASMGASAVLLFAAPHSPLATPWSFAGGHLVSALAGIACALWLPPSVAGAAAVALAILLMLYLKCLHPPGGATALTMVLGRATVESHGFALLLLPVGLNVAVLLALALLINNLLLRRPYPPAPRPAPSRPAVEADWTLGRFGLARADLHAALREMNAFIDVTEDDLERIYARAAGHALARRVGDLRAHEIMTADVVSAEFGDELEYVWELMRTRKVKGVPILDRARHVVGIVTIVDFLKLAGPRAPGHVFERLRRMLQRTPETASDKPEVVGQIMSRPAVTARADAHAVTLMPLFAQHHIHHIPIVDASDKLVGIVTQSDLMAALYRHGAALA